MFSVRGEIDLGMVAVLHLQCMNHKGTNNTKQHEGVRFAQRKVKPQMEEMNTDWIAALWLQWMHHAEDTEGAEKNV